MILSVFVLTVGGTKIEVPFTNNLSFKVFHFYLNRVGNRHVFSRDNLFVIWWLDSQIQPLDSLCPFSLGDVIHLLNPASSPLLTRIRWNEVRQRIIKGQSVYMASYASRGQDWSDQKEKWDSCMGPPQNSVRCILHMRLAHASWRSPLLCHGTGHITLCCNIFLHFCPLCGV